MGHTRLVKPIPTIKSSDVGGRVKGIGLWQMSWCYHLRALLRLAQGCHEQPSATIFDSRTLQSSPESGVRAGYDGSLSLVHNTL